jgi:hypothetical protein
MALHQKKEKQPKYLAFRSPFYIGQDKSIVAGKNGRTNANLRLPWLLEQCGSK